MTSTRKLQLTLACSLSLAFSARAVSVVYPNGNPGDWSDLITTAPAPITSHASGGPGNHPYTQIYNVPDEYQSPGYGSGPYSFFGPGISTTRGLYQSVDVYIDANWGVPNPSYAQSFWIDMTPNSSDGGAIYGAEHNFRVTAQGGQVAVSVDGQGSPISTITQSGWYDFQMTWLPDANPANPLISAMNIFSLDVNGNIAALVGTTTVLANSPGGPTLSGNLTGSGYVWFTVWANGSAGDTLNVADVKAASVPDGSWTLSLLGFGCAALAGLRRRLQLA
jgi:hypothetical protein